MTHIFASARKTLILDVVGQSVVLRGAKGRPTTRTFRNRYTLRKFVAAQLATAAKAGLVSVNR